VTERPHATDADRLRRCGELICGYGWQRGLARVLGAYHPQGARESIDDRYVRRVAAGTHPAPAWWWEVFRTELQKQLSGLSARRDRIARAIRTLPVTSTAKQPQP